MLICWLCLSFVTGIFHFEPSVIIVCMEIIANSLEETKGLGCRIADSLISGSVVQLIGDVGAGKTTLVKAIATRLGVEDEVQSPTFVLSRVYQLPNGNDFYHYDFYRLAEPGILLTDIREVTSDDSSIVMVEWADIVEGVLPRDRLIVDIVTIGEMSRKFTFRSNGPKSNQIIEGLKI